MKLDKIPQEITETKRVRAWGRPFRVKTGSVPVNLQIEGIPYLANGNIYEIPANSFLWCNDIEGTTLELEDSENT